MRSRVASGDGRAGCLYPRGNLRVDVGVFHVVEVHLSGSSRSDSASQRFCVHIFSFFSRRAPEQSCGPSVSVRCRPKPRGIERRDRRLVALRRRRRLVRIRPSAPVLAVVPVRVRAFSSPFRAVRRPSHPAGGSLFMAYRWPATNAPSEFSRRRRRRRAFSQSSFRGVRALSFRVRLRRTSLERASVPSSRVRACPRWRLVFSAPRGLRRRDALLHPGFQTKVLHLKRS